MRSARGKAIGAVILATLAWGSTPVFIKIFSEPDHFPAIECQEALDPFTQTVGRYGAALIGLLILSLLKKDMRLTRLKRRWWLLMLVPTLPNIALQICWVGAFYFLMPTMASLLAKLATILSLAFTYIFFRDERKLIGSWKFLTAAVVGLGAAVGVVLSSVARPIDPAAARPAAEGAVLLYGALLIVGSSTFWGLYSVGIKFVMRKNAIPSAPAFVIAAVYMVVAFMVLTALFGDYGKFARIGWKLTGLIVLSGTVNIAVPHILYYYSIRRVGVAVTALVTMCTTFITAALSFAVFGEMLTVEQTCLGLVLMTSAAAAVWLSRRDRTAPRKLPLREPPID